jgi:flagellar capping protein FliD
MMRLLNPWVILALLLAAAGLYRYGYHNGWDTRDTEMQLEIAKKNEEARELERAMTSKLVANTNQLQEANNALTEKSSALDRAIRAGRVRLPTPSCVQTSPSPTAPVGDRDEASSESDRQTLAAIAAIVADGDRATNQLNACIDAYNQMRESVNGQH